VGESKPVKEDGSLDARADRELDRLITKRYDPRDGDALVEPSYAESVWQAMRESQSLKRLFGHMVTGKLSPAREGQ
jgi:hypothetical protein